ncbi:PQQ-dependent sugar dehydrogenase [Dactylosporangium sp. AC04546]|uniref:PQQ-dependent sugar dehydrogenase n=1 Tax=Dactylosporangium sp. AC04546 TaxID=2862460 RepID=UPI001EE07D2D|nr:PQQ-dependent sugar dehydrogenase [Dactylosporangium sp. AC04546]WVK83507.1 PQQ-dependent sugar dehydrogenase [Dactylosporangium sp. AC04546]
MAPSPRRWRRLLTAATVAAGSSVVAAFANAPAATAIPLPATDYQHVQLALGSAELGEPMSLAVLPDRSVLHTARDGTVRYTDAAGNTKVAGKLSVYTHDEEGLQGVAADPGFATNRWVWLYYSPTLSTPAGDSPATGTDANWNTWKGHLNLSRFTLKADNTLDLASEKVVLTVDNDRGQCCHVGGDIDFDAQGNLYLTTGDDTNPFESAGYSPLDERTNRNPQYDAQRSSGNTNDLRGKLLRIKPNADGTYAIPSGNLFAPGTAKTRPEIYAMGFRNPFRMSVDKPTGVVYLGDYGPDAGTTSSTRGPSGQVEFNRITGPGNYGWPYCTGTNTTTETYNEWDFAANTGAAKYNCTGGPTNNSFRNTGLTTLPAAKSAWIRYAGDAGTPPEFGTGSESPMGGPVYRYNASLNSAVKFPQSLDGNFFAGEYGRRWIKPVKINADGSPGEISTFPWAGTQVMDMAFGPDGALYVLDYGTGSNNQALYRIEYVGGGNRAPTAKITPSVTSGPNPLTVSFSSAGSADPEGGALTYAWDFDGNGTTDSTAANPSFTYTTNGTKTPTLTVRDPQGLTGSASTVITVGNTAPTVRLTLPASGQLFNFGDTIPFQVTVTDPEDGTINCSRVSVTYFLGHDSHSHQITGKTGCSGSITIPVDGEHDAAANIYGLFDAAYTDNGGLTTHSITTLQPKHRQGEHFGGQSGIQIANHTAAEGGATAGFIENGDWISYSPYLLNNATQFTARVASAGAGGTIEVRAGSPTGTLLGTATVPNTGSWETYTNVSANISGAPSSATTLYLVFKGGAGNLFDVDAFTFATGGTNPGTPVVNLKSLTNNLYVSAPNATTALIANSSTVGLAQQFDLVDLGGGKVALRSKANNMFVCAENAGANPLVANRAAAGAWETFILIRNADGSESLQAQVNGMYVVAENNGAGSLIANRTAIGPWEKFDLVGA